VGAYAVYKEIKMKVKFIHIPNGLTPFLAEYRMNLFAKDNCPAVMKIDTWLDLWLERYFKGRSVNNRTNYLISDNPDRNHRGIIPVTSVKELPSDITEIWVLGNAKFLQQFVYTATAFEIHTQREYTEYLLTCLNQFPEFVLFEQTISNRMSVLNYKHSHILNRIDL